MPRILAAGFHFANSLQHIPFVSWRLSNRPDLLISDIASIQMKTIDEIRHENLLLLIGKFGTVQALANAVGKSHAQISQLKTRAVHSATGKPRTIGDDLARTFEQRCDLPLGWFDNPHTSIDAEGPDHHQQQSTPAPLDLPQRSAHPDPHIRKAIAILEGLDREGRIEALGAIKVVAASHHRTASRSTG